MIPGQVLDLLVRLRQAQADATRQRCDLMQRKHRQACAHAQRCADDLEVAARLELAAVDPVFHGLRLAHLQHGRDTWERACAIREEAFGAWAIARTAAQGAAIRLHVAQDARATVRRESTRRTLMRAGIDRAQPMPGGAGEGPC